MTQVDATWGGGCVGVGGCQRGGKSALSIGQQEGKSCTCLPCFQPHNHKYLHPRNANQCSRPPLPTLSYPTHRPTPKAPFIISPGGWPVRRGWCLSSTSAFMVSCPTQIYLHPCIATRCSPMPPPAPLLGPPRSLPPHTHTQAPSSHRVDGLCATAGGSSQQVGDVEV